MKRSLKLRIRAAALVFAVLGVAGAGVAATADSGSSTVATCGRWCY